MIALIAAITLACAAPRYTIPIEPFTPATASTPVAVDTFVVENRASPSRPGIGRLRNGTFSSVEYPKWSPKFGDQLALDLRAYFGASTKPGDGSIRVKATILDAQIGFLPGAAEMDPFISVFAAGAKRHLVAKARIQFEVERDGRVAQTFLFEQEVTGEGSIATDEIAAKSVAMMMAKFRNEAFPRIQTEFLQRYL